MPTREVTQFVFLDNTTERNLLSRAERERRRACDSCRHNKRRCDGKETCSQCVSRNFTCTYEQPTLKKPQQTVALLQARLEHAEEALRNAQTQPIVPPWTAKMSKSLEAPFASQPEASVDDITSRFSSMTVQETCFQGLVETAGAEKLNRHYSGKAMVGSGDDTTLSDCCIIQQTIQKSSFWPVKPHPSAYVFPDDDLVDSLVALYFSNVNSLLPLIYRPRFELGVAQRLYRNNPGFGTAVLLVCALGTLFLPDADDRAQLAHKWYDQAVLYSYGRGVPPTLDDVQAYCLAARFLDFTADPRITWSVLGFGLCIARDMGLGTPKPPGNTTSPGIEESEKRVLWILVVHETQLNAFLGRTAPFDPIDIQFTLPSELPGEEPGHLGFLNCLVKLYPLQHYLLRFLYPNTIEHDDQDNPVDARPIIPLVDAALAEWSASLPAHLRWDPDAVGDQCESASLRVLYLHTRMLLHRAFIRVELEAYKLPTLCKAAARECIRVADTQMRNGGRSLLYGQNPTFEAAMLLLLDAWDREEDQDTEYVFMHMAVGVLKAQSERWPSSGHLIRILERLIALDEDSSNGCGLHRAVV